MKNTKRSLITSLVTLLLCSCMFIGSTFAWFTDTVSNTGNKIQAGTLDIKLSENVYNEDGSFKELKEIMDGSAPIFNYDKWEPGYTDYRGLTIENAGNLALKFKLDVISTTPQTEGAKLSDVIDVYVKVLTDGDSKAKPASFEAVKNDTSFTNVGTLSSLLDSTDSDGAIWGIILADGQSIDDVTDSSHKSIAKTKAETIQLVLHMREDAGNDYQGLSVGESFALNLYATQYTFEKDGFGSEQYDKNSKYESESEPITYTVSFDMCGHGTQVAPIENVVAGSTISAPENPQETGYTFLGWTIVPGMVNWDFDSDTVSANITLYANWSTKTTTLTLNKNNGNSDGSATITYNATSTTNFTAPTRSDYVLMGLYTATSGGDKVLNADGSLVSGVNGWTTNDGKWAKDAESATLYAQWGHTVTITADGVTVSNIKDSNYNYYSLSNGDQITTVVSDGEYYSMHAETPPEEGFKLTIGGFEVNVGKDYQLTETGKLYGSEYTKIYFYQDGEVKYTENGSQMYFGGGGNVYGDVTFTVSSRECD